MLSQSVIKYIRSLKLKKFRDEYGVFIAEGNKLVQDISSSDFTVEKIIATNEWLKSVDLKNKKNIHEIVEVKLSDLEKISNLKSAPEVIAVVKMPDLKLDDTLLFQGISLVLDGVQDPGNLGTIIRTSDWFGIRNIICSNDCVDVFNSKVVQSTMGAITRVKVYYTDLIAFLERNKSGAKLPVYGAYLEGENIYSHSLSKNGLVVLGSEGRGISKELMPLISTKIFIPSFSEQADFSESLNVSIACAIVCSEFKRRNFNT